LDLRGLSVAGSLVSVIFKLLDSIRRQHAAAGKVQVTFCALSTVPVIASAISGAVAPASASNVAAVPRLP